MPPMIATPVAISKDQDQDQDQEFELDIRVSSVTVLPVLSPTIATGGCCGHTDTCRTVSPC